MLIDRQKYVIVHYISDNVIDCLAVILFYFAYILYIHLYAQNLYLFIISISISKLLSNYYLFLFYTVDISIMPILDMNIVNVMVLCALIIVIIYIADCFCCLLRILCFYLNIICLSFIILISIIRIFPICVLNCLLISFLSSSLSIILRNTHIYL